MMRTVMFASILATSASTANAQDTSGDPEAGRVFARQVCSPCHAVTAEQASQRVIAIGPDFQTIANTPGMNSAALTAALRTSHESMPNIIIKGSDLSDVIAYILSLRKNR